jgi:hypothetical protein
MSPAIFASDLFSVSIIDRLLANSSLEPADRIPLLQAKITLLTNDLANSSAQIAQLSSPIHANPPPGPVASSLRVAHRPDQSGNGDAARVRTPLAETLDSPLLESLRCRLQVAHLLLAVTPVRLHEAESESTLIETTCKKRLKRLKNESKIGQAEGTALLGEYMRIRVENLALLAKIEEHLGRDGRANRWRDLVDTLKQEGL